MFGCKSSCSRATLKQIFKHMGVRARTDADAAHYRYLEGFYKQDKRYGEDFSRMKGVNK